MPATVFSAGRGTRTNEAQAWSPENYSLLRRLHIIALLIFQDTFESIIINEGLKLHKHKAKEKWPFHYLSHRLHDTKGTNSISQQDTMLQPQIIAFKSDHSISY